MGNYRILKFVYQAYGRGDVAPFFEAMHDEIVLEYCVPAEIFQFAGPLKGRQQVLEGIAKIAGEYEWLKFDLNHLLTDGDLAVALTSGRIRHRHSGSVFKVDMVDVIRMKNGKIIDVKEYFDSLGVLMKTGFSRATITEFAAKLRPPPGRGTPADGLSRIARNRA